MIQTFDISKYNNIFVTSDWHLYHNNIIRYQKRPFDNFNEMNKVIINNYNNIAKENDLVINLGDLMFGKDSNPDFLKDILSNLNGDTILIRGNHDNKTDDFYKDSGFLAVFEILRINNMLFCHYPFDKPDYFSDIEKKYFDELKNYNILYYGHTHSRASSLKTIKTVNCCVDFENNNYKPIKILSNMLEW